MLTQRTEGEFMANCCAPMLAASEAELQRLKRDDPELVSEYQSTKGFTANYESFDDRTYLRFIA